MTPFSYEMRFLQSVALKSPQYPALDETGMLMASNEEPPTFIESNNYPAIKTQKTVNLVGGIVLGSLLGLIGGFFFAHGTSRKY